MERKTRKSGDRASLARRALGLLMVVALLYLVIVTGADMITPRLYDLVWAVSES